MPQDTKISDLPTGTPADGDYIPYVSGGTTKKATKADLKGEIGDTGAGYTASSASTVSLGTGSKTFTTQAGLAYTPGARVRCSFASDGEFYMEGLVTSYSGTTLIINMDRASAGGSTNSWKINLAGDVGETGSQGIQGIQGEPGDLTQAVADTLYEPIKEVDDNYVTDIEKASLSLSGTGVYSLPSVLDNGDGTITLGSGDYVFAQDADGTAPFLKYTIAGASYSFTDNVTNYVVANYNSGSPIITVVTSTATIDNQIVIPIITVFRTGTHLDILHWDEAAKSPTGKLQRRIVRTQRFALEPGGLVLGETTGRNVTLTAGNVWNGLHQNAIPAFDSTNTGTDFLELYVHVAGVYTKSTITAYNNTQYDDGTGVQTLGTGRYAVNWIFRSVNDNENEVYVLLGTGNYTLAQAQASAVPATIPAEILSTAILTGRIIVQKSASTATQIDSAFVSNFNSSPTNDHSTLSNLGYANAGHTGTMAEFNGTISDGDFSPAETAATIGSLIAGAALKVTPIDADYFGYADSEASNVLKTFTWASFKARLQTVFDALYAPKASPTFTGTVTLPTGLTGVLRADTGVVSTDSDVTDLVSAASTTAAGKIEIAIGSEADTGTDDTRALSPKAVNDSHNIPSVAPGTSGNIMTSNGTDWVSSTPAASATFWTTVPGTPVRVGNTSFTITDTSNANLYDHLISKGTCLKWTDTATTKQAMVVSAAYATNTVTVTIIGDTLAASATMNTFKYGMEKARVQSFVYAGTVGATGTDVTNQFYAPFNMKVFGADIRLGTAGNGTTTVDINDDGTTMFTTKPSISTTNTADLDNTADSGIVAVEDSKITVDLDAVAATPGVDLYVYLYYTPDQNVHLT